MLENEDVIAPVGPAEEYAGRVSAALALRNIHDYRSALAQLKRAVAVAPDKVEGRLLLGMTYGDLGQHRAAEQALREAMALDPESDQVRKVLGALLIKQGKHAAAARCLEPLAERGDDPDAMRAYVGAMAQTPRGLKRAIAVLERAYHRAPENEELAQQLADAYLKDGYPAAVVRLLAPLAKKNAPSALMLQYALALDATGNKRDAARVVEAIAKLLPGAAFIWQLVILFALNAGETGKAVDAARRVIELEPGSGPGWQMLAVVLSQEGDRAEAAQAAQEAIRLAREQGYSDDQMQGLHDIVAMADASFVPREVPFTLQLPFPTF